DLQLRPRGSGDARAGQPAADLPRVPGHRLRPAVAGELCAALHGRGVRARPRDDAGASPGDAARRGPAGWRARRHRTGVWASALADALASGAADWRAGFVRDHAARLVARVWWASAGRRAQGPEPRQP